jgi:hypothetical protein
MELKMPMFLNKFFEVIMGIEIALIKSGGRFCAGGSLLLVARVCSSSSTVQIPLDVRDC